MTNLRTRCREVALQALYLAEHHGPDPTPVALAFVEERLGEPRLRKIARRYVAGVRSRLGEIDALIAARAENWRIDRMALIDRNILRLAVFEFLHCPKVPVKVAINEAVELAKRFGSGQSGRFVNGILNQLQDVRPNLEAGPDPEAGSDATPEAESGAEPRSEPEADATP
jgi:N utilization substance protein B